MRTLAVLIAGILVSIARPGASAEPGCIEELTNTLGVLSARHWNEEYRVAAGAESSAARLCGDAPTSLQAAERMLSQLGDPAVRIVDAAHFRRTLEEWMGNPVVGVGLTELLSIDVDERTGLLTVVAPVRASPAARAGLRAGDVVTSIGGAATGPLGLTGSMERLRLAVGERVELEVLRDERTREVALQAVELPPLTPVAVEHPLNGDRDTLYVRLTQFIPGAAAKLKAAIDGASAVDAIVLDLRDNPGGLVDELLQVAGLFLAPGTSIAQVDGTEPAVLAVAGDAEPIGTPLYVIIGPGSASAAEALAGALQSQRRARLYGERTFGKGLVHETLPMGDDAMLIFPAGQLETADGRRILHNGIAPDVVTAKPLEAIGSDLAK